MWMPAYWDITAGHAMMTCKRVHYSGRVQGVGFRYTVRNLAKGFPVTGFVRNLNDGRVELVVEGQSSDIEAFLQAITQRMAEYILDTSIQDESVEGHQGFDIRY
jgi:acylphosphatase